VRIGDGLKYYSPEARKCNFSYHPKHATFKKIYMCGDTMNNVPAQECGLATEQYQSPEARKSNSFFSFYQQAIPSIYMCGVT
jgi:hypothetical protein